jgi:hypothetical protein
VERRGQSPWGERVVDDGEALGGFSAFDLPDDAEPTDLDVFTSVRGNRNSVELHAHSASFRYTVVFTRIGSYRTACTVSTAEWGTK